MNSPGRAKGTPRRAAHEAAPVQRPGQLASAPSDDADDEARLREQVVTAMRRLDALGMNRGSTGNASVRWREGMLITPTGMGAEDLRPEHLAWVGWDGEVQGEWQPSSEWAFHRAAYRGRAEVQAVLHTHATHAAALACLRRPLPAFHYMVAVAGGTDVPLVPYFTFGTEALSQGVGQALTDRWACLLANHGLVSTGRSMAQAMKVMQEIESLCAVYLKALAVGEPVVLSAEEMAVVIDKFRGYGASRARPGAPGPGQGR